MNRIFSLWQAAGFAVTTFLGTILHFLYDWTGESVFISPFSGVNESTWEHMKLLFWPLFLFALIQRHFFREQRNFWGVKLVQTLLGLILIPVLFYTWNGSFGKSPDWVNITIFYLSAAAAFLPEQTLFRKDKLFCKYSGLSFVLLCVLGILFILFTFLPPEIPLFRDPLTGSFGL